VARLTCQLRYKYPVSLRAIIDHVFEYAPSQATPGRGQLLLP